MSPFFSLQSTTSLHGNFKTLDQLQRLCLAQQNTEEKVVNVNDE
jgi:hypothetical protein